MSTKLALFTSLYRDARSTKYKTYHLHVGARGGVVVKVPRYKQADRGFDSR
jgi:hypothetical protein